MLHEFAIVWSKVGVLHRVQPIDWIENRMMMVMMLMVMGRRLQSAVIAGRVVGGVRLRL